MSKRFIDNSILPKGWRKVKPTLKLAFYHFWINCDKAGIFEIDEELFEFETGVPWPSEDDFKVLEELGLIQRNSEIILLNDYSPVDNGRLGTSNAHLPVKRSIEKYSLLYDENSFRLSINKNISKVQATFNQPSLKVVEEEGEGEMEEEVFKGGLGENELNESDIKLLKLVAEYFGFNEIRNHDKFSQLFVFFNILKTDKKHLYFESQFTAYRDYKELSKQSKHSFPKFLGSIETRFSDGGWNQENWSDKLRSISTESLSIGTVDRNAALAEKLKKQA